MASQAVTSGASVKTVQAQLGHRSGNGRAQVFDISDTKRSDDSIESLKPSLLRAGKRCTKQVVSTPGQTDASPDFDEAYESLKLLVARGRNAG